jgi:hypothetical protein
MLPDLLRVHDKITAGYTLETLEPELAPPAFWSHWLWVSDPAEEVSAKQPLSEGHLVGLILARLAAHPSKWLAKVLFPGMLQGAQPDRPAQTIKASALSPESYTSLTQRPHHAAVQHLQLHLLEILAECPPEDVFAHTGALFSRAGQLLLATTEPLPQNPALDDPEGLEPGSTERPPRWSLERLREQLNIFAAIFRALTLRCAAKPPPNDLPTHDICEFHVSAAMDTFYELTMLFDLPPGAVAVYRHQFVGRYHSVSQVIYYSYPDYQRRTQLTAEEIQTGEPAICAVAPLLELEPTVQRLREDDVFHGDPTLPNADVAPWRIVLTAGVFYLLHNDGTVYTSENAKKLFALVAHKRKAR